jgi:transcriptional regulator with XRE-family HTH domain
MTRRTHPIVAELREIRRSRGLSQEAVARKAGTTKAMISLWETGQSTPGLASADAYAQALGYTLALTPREAAQ